MDGAREPCGRAVHADVGRVVVRRAPLRDDHLRVVPLPGAEQQPGARARQVGQHPLHPGGHQEPTVRTAVGVYVTSLLNAALLHLQGNPAKILLEQDADAASDGGRAGRAPLQQPPPDHALHRRATCVCAGDVRRLRSQSGRQP